MWRASLGLWMLMATLFSSRSEGQSATDFCCCKEREKHPRSKALRGKGEKYKLPCYIIRAYYEFEKHTIVVSVVIRTRSCAQTSLNSNRS
jgi:hypothetical protein